MDPVRFGVLGARSSIARAAVIPAIEAALGGSLQAIIFKDTSVAEAAALVLAGKKLGKAALIPRDWIAGNAPGSYALPDGALAWAAACSAAALVGRGSRSARNCSAGSGRAATTRP